MGGGGWIVFILLYIEVFFGDGFVDCANFLLNNISSVLMWLTGFLQLLVVLGDGGEEGVLDSMYFIVFMWEGGAGRGDCGVANCVIKKSVVGFPCAFDAI